MKNKRLRQFPGWPPDAGEAFGKTYTSPTSEQAIVKEVMPSHDNLVSFKADFEGRTLGYDYPAANSREAEAIKKAISEHLGVSIFDLGDLMIEAEA
jgi:hypothetical protein